MIIVDFLFKAIIAFAVAITLTIFALIIYACCKIASDNNYDDEDIDELEEEENYDL